MLLFFADSLEIPGEGLNAARMVDFPRSDIPISAAAKDDRTIGASIITKFCQDNRKQMQAVTKEERAAKSNQT